MSEWLVYMVRCCDTSLYTGIATDVERRFDEHQDHRGKGAKYLRARRPLTLVYVQSVGNRRLALKIEYQMKKLPKHKKEALVKGDVCLSSLVTIDCV